jgi:kinesin family member 17
LCNTNYCAGTGQAVFVDETSGEIKLLNVKQPEQAPR